MSRASMISERKLALDGRMWPKERICVEIRREVGSSNSKREGKGAGVMECGKRRVGT